MRITYSIILVSDMARSVAFYRDIVGMPLKFESPHWTEFETDGATWALHLCDGPTNDSGVVRSETAGCCRPGIQVANLNEFHARMLKNGALCAQEPTRTFGTRIAQYIDPDGLTFSVSEAKPDE